MANRKSKRTRRRDTTVPNGPRIDRFTIANNPLGPVPPCQIDIRPFTVFIGKQGTGKSLVAQVLYALEELPYLSQFVAARETEALIDDPKQLFARILSQLRSTQRGFAGFVGSNREKGTRIGWTRGEPWEIPVKSSSLAFSLFRNAGVVYPTVNLQDSIRAFGQKAIRPIQHAVFIPTERMVVSQLRSALAEKILTLPITYELFALWIDAAHSVWDEVDDERAEQIWDLSQEALGGYAKRVGTQWKWAFREGSGKSRKSRTIDLDMASSGQRANWSLGFLGRSLFALRQLRDYAQKITVFIEEPELHLHPSAEVNMTRILAILVNAGFRVVVTTHSLHTLYELNNLMLAHARFGDEHRKGIPDPSMRIPAREVTVYGFSKGAPTDLVDRERSFIDEHELGDVGAELGSEMNFIMNVERG